MKHNTQDLIQLAIQKGLLTKENLKYLYTQETLNADIDSFIGQIVKSGLLSDNTVAELIEELNTYDRVARESTPTLAMANTVKHSGGEAKTTLANKQDTLFTAAKEMDARDTHSSIIPHPKPLKTVGRYEIIKLLGEGGMGSVYQAYDLALDRYVALKFIRSRDPAAKKRLILEGRAQARLDHPSICKVYEVGEEEHQIFVAMQYIQGDTLEKMSKVLTLEQKVKLMADAADALHAAHKEGLIHRDIKPSNIMVEKTQDGRLQPCILDFGLVKEVASKGITVTGEILGTPCYMAPEQAKGRTDNLDRRTDVYALGATLYEIFTDRPPFEGFNPMEVLLQVLKAEPVPIKKIDPSIPQDIDTIVLKCLEKEPQRRYDSAKALADDLRRYLDGALIQAKPVSWQYKIWQKTKEHKITIASLSAAVLVVIITLGFGLWTTWRSVQQERLAQELGQKFGQQVKEIETIMQVASLLPLHNVQREKLLVKEKMEDIRKQMQQVGRVGIGPGNYALGQGYLTLGDYLKAREHIELALSNGYDTPDANYTLGQIMGALYQKALEEASQITSSDIRKSREREIEKEYRDPALEYLRKSRSLVAVSPSYVEGLIAFYEKKYNEALEKSQKAFEQTPSLYEAKKLEADIYLQIGSDKQEIGDYESAKEDYQKAGQAYKVAITIGESANTVYEGECQRWLRTMELGLSSAQIDLSKEAYNQALKACDKALIANPESGEAYQKKSRVYWRWAESEIIRSGTPDEYLDKAIEMAKQAVFYNPKDMYAFYDMGNSYLQKADYYEKKQEQASFLDLAAESYLKAIEISPNYALPYNGLGLVYWKKGELEIEEDNDGRDLLDKAISKYKKSIELAPNFAAYINMGLAAWSKANYEAMHGIEPIESYNFSIKSLNSAIELNPKYANTYNSIGVTYMDKGLFLINLGLDPTEVFDLAFKNYQKCLDFDSNNSDAYYNFGITYIRKANYFFTQKRDPSSLLVQARSLLESSAKLNPNISEIYLEQSDIEILAARWQMEQDKASLASFNKAREILRKVPEDKINASFYKTLAETYRWQAEWQIKNKKTAQKEITEGLGLIKKAISIDSELGEAIALEGAFYLLKAKQENTQKADLAQQAEMFFKKAIQTNLFLKSSYEPLIIEARNLQK